MGKTNNVVIVGASSSIGRSVVDQFQPSSKHIIASYLSKQHMKPKENVSFLKLDLSIDKSIGSFVKEVHSVMPHLDTLIFLAGILPGKNLREYQPEDIEKVMTVNFTGQAKVIKGLLPLLDASSQIIMVSSISAQKGSYDPIYSASKGAILSFVKSLSSGLGGVRVNAIAPGLIEESTMAREMSASRREFHRQQTSSKELLSMSDLAQVIFDVSQKHWKHMNGACIDLNGGQYVR